MCSHRIDQILFAKREKITAKPKFYQKRKKYKLELGKPWTHTINDIELLNNKKEVLTKTVEMSKITISAAWFIKLITNKSSKTFINFTKTRLFQAVYITSTIFKNIKIFIKSFYHLSHKQLF